MVQFGSLKNGAVFKMKVAGYTGTFAKVSTQHVFNVFTMNQGIPPKAADYVEHVGWLVVVNEHGDQIAILPLDGPQAKASDAQGDTAGRAYLEAKLAGSDYHANRIRELNRRG